MQKPKSLVDSLPFVWQTVRGQREKLTACSRYMVPRHKRMQDEVMGVEHPSDFSSERVAGFFIS